MKGRWSHDPLEKWAALLLIFAAAVHGGLAPEHLKEWWGYGLFFIIAGALQLVLALALLTDAVNERDSGAGWRRIKAWMYGLGIAGNLALIALYVVSRTTGIPFLGPGAGEVEGVAPIDIATKVAELAAVLLLALLLQRLRTSDPSTQTAKAA